MAITADIHIQTATKCWFRFDTEEFRPTRNWSDQLSIKTDTNQYPVDCGTLSTQLYNTVQGEISAGNTVGSTHVKITVENATATFAGPGLAPMAKQSIDLALSGDEITSASDVSTYIQAHVAALVKNAKYN